MSRRRPVKPQQLLISRTALNFGDPVSVVCGCHVRNWASEPSSGSSAVTSKASSGLAAANSPDYKSQAPRAR
ncbi:MAG: hypothetical protein Ct9H300mP32_6860 [Verrucomicrobiota bacterium]|nr:MAG: hypothetical protein Ct9H300mP32_6860 [Verrucomicrobiota bacterium]